MNIAAFLVSGHKLTSIDASIYNVAKLAFTETPRDELQWNGLKSSTLAASFCRKKHLQLSTKIRFQTLSGQNSLKNAFSNSFSCILFSSSKIFLILLDACLALFFFTQSYQTKMKLFTYKKFDKKNKFIEDSKAKLRSNLI